MSGILTKKIRKINDSFGLNGLEMRETGRLLGLVFGLYQFGGEFKKMLVEWTILFIIQISIIVS